MFGGEILDDLQDVADEIADGIRNGRERIADALHMWVGAFVHHSLALDCLALLDGMRQLVGQQFQPALALGIILSFVKENMPSEGKGARADLVRQFLRLPIGVKPHI